MAELNRCAHAPCTCPLPEGEKYCSPYCLDAGLDPEIVCQCGHHGCMEIPPTEPGDIL